MNKKDYRLIGSLDPNNAMENLFDDLENASSTYSNLELDMSSQTLSHSQPRCNMKRPLLADNKKAAKFKYDTSCTNTDKLQTMKQSQHERAAIIENSTSSSFMTDSNKKSCKKQSCQSEYTFEALQPSGRNRSETSHCKTYSNISRTQSSQVR